MIVRNDLHVARTPTMNAAPEFSVTLSAPLFAHLRAEARRLDVPLEWLVAALVADTLEAEGEDKVAA
jgi:hypothetical protein